MGFVRAEFAGNESALTSATRRCPPRPVQRGQRPLPHFSSQPRSRACAPGPVHVGRQHVSAAVGARCSSAHTAHAQSGHLPSPPVKFKQDRSLYPLGPDSGTPDFTRVHIKIKGTCGKSLEVESGYRRQDDGPGHSAYLGLTGRTSGQGCGPDRSTGSYAGTAGAFLQSTPPHRAPDPEHPEGTHAQKKQPAAWLSWRGESAGAAALLAAPQPKRVLRWGMVISDLLPHPGRHSMAQTGLGETGAPRTAAA